MKNASLKEKSILSLKSKVLIATLVLAIIVGLGTVVQAVPDNGIDRVLYRQTAHFNPFTLSTGVNFARRPGNVPELPEKANWRARIRVPCKCHPRSPWQPGNPWK